MPPNLALHGGGDTTIDVIGGGNVEIDGLLGRLIPEAIPLGDRMLQQVREQLTGDGAFSDGPVSPASGLGTDALSHYDDLIDRNSILAAALGACDCWGQDRNCPICDGRGGSG